MTRRVYLHVGAPKSGTTYLQGVLDANRDRLGQAGVRVVGERHLDRVHAAMVVREDPRLESLPDAASQAWARLVADIRSWSGEVAILSYELFAGADADQVQRALRDLHGIEVHVVITARDLGRAVPSAWQERLKFALTTPLEKWRPRPESDGARAEWGWRTMDPAGVAGRWGAGLPADRVHIVTLPRDAADEHELWRRFAAACGIEVPGLDLAVTRSNESLGVVAAELLRRVNERVTAPITGSREQSLWLRDVLAHQVLVDLGREPIGLTDAQYAEAVERSSASVAALAEAGYDIRGELDDLAATRPAARTPGEVTDQELLGAALETIVRLLMIVRERSRADAEVRSSEPDRRRGVGAVGKDLVRRATAPRVDRRTAQLEARVEQLEAQVASSRALHLRVAEVTDLVMELLLPEGQVNESVTGRAISRYRKESL